MQRTYTTAKSTAQDATLTGRHRTVMVRHFRFSGLEEGKENMIGYPYLAIGLVDALVGAGPGTKLFGSKIGGALVAVLVFGFFAGLRALLVGFN